MRMRSAWWIVCSVVWGCNGNDDTPDGGTPPADGSVPVDASTYPDATAHNDATVNPFACDPTTTPIQGGGTTGGPINQEMWVMLFAPESDRPLPDEVVVVKKSNGDELIAKTGSDGCVRFSDPTLIGQEVLDAISIPMFASPAELPRELFDAILEWTQEKGYTFVRPEYDVVIDYSFLP